MARKLLKKSKGGFRPGAGRKPKPNKEQFATINVILRRDTVEALRQGAGKKWVGEFLQRHLDRYPLPSFTEDQALRLGRPEIKLIKRRKVPVVISAGLPHRVKRPTRTTRQMEILRKFREA